MLLGGTAVDHDDVCTGYLCVLCNVKNVLDVGTYVCLCWCSLLCLIFVATRSSEVPMCPSHIEKIGLAKKKKSNFDPQPQSNKGSRPKMNFQIKNYFEVVFSVRIFVPPLSMKPSVSLPQSSVCLCCVNTLHALSCHVSFVRSVVCAYLTNKTGFRLYLPPSNGAILFLGRKSAYFEVFHTPSISYFEVQRGTLCSARRYHMNW